MKPPAELTQLFRSRGLKVTPQRQCIFRALDGNAVHPTAESIHAAAVREMPTISLKTVYSTLNDLAAMGQIQQLDLGTGSTRFDPNVEGHHHVVCNACGAVRDLYFSADIHVSGEQLEGFAVESTEVVLRGRCAACTAAA